ncbi:MAG: hypothetical protein A2Z28_02440 [Chloroflexi bacterium RBG_16_51_9]|nr:MAG: hypothetical protein A2Z28_02440 [Chloroflexi bacterium RBG_16_51_9]
MRSDTNAIQDAKPENVKVMVDSAKKYGIYYGIRPTQKELDYLIKRGNKMNKRILWLVVGSLMALSLVMAACGPAAAPTAPTTPAETTPTTPAKLGEEPTQKEVVKPSAEVPKYGGTLVFNGGDISTWDPSRVVTSAVINLTHQELWAGDWARGIAGGFGTKETDWGAGNNDLFDLKMGHLVESWKWTVDDSKDQGTIVYQVRQGVHFSLNTNSEASRLVNGREVTADDILYTLKRATTDTFAYVYRSNVELRNIDITKTAPWEITVKVPISTLISVISRLGDTMLTSPPELVTKYGDLQNWKNSVGTGPFMVTEYVPGSTVLLLRNPNFWMKDPVGPGKGNQLPYLDSVKTINLPDVSTRQAAFRTGKIDFISGIAREDAPQMRKAAPELIRETSSTSNQGRGTPLHMRIDKPPFNDVRVRRAMIMAIDFNSILQGLYGGVGQIITFPYSYIPEYAELYLGLNDPEMPASVKELYTYNPEKAKQLLKEAGYPNGLKTEALLTSTQVDYYSILKDMLSKANIDLTLDIKDSAVVNNQRDARTFNSMITDTTGPVAAFYYARRLQGQEGNHSFINDPYINEAVTRMRRAAIFDLHEAMRIYKKDIFPYVLEQAYAIPDVIGSTYRFWWPWLKNYSGENTVGYDDPIWPQYIWYDEGLKKSLGY